MADSKLNLEKLRVRNQPLAKVVEAYVVGKTARDEPTAIARDIAIALQARNPTTTLAKALSEYEKSLSIESMTKKIAEDLT